MRVKLIATLGAIAIAVATTQFAAAGERQRTRKPPAPSATSTEQFRNANAWTAPLAHPGMYPYTGG